jgi:PST family polysaccharide transporter
LIANLIKKFKNNEMLNSSFFTSIGTLIGFISGFVVTKVVAIYLGPGGIAVIGQFQNFVAINTSFASGGIQQGVVKYLAEFREQEDMKSVILTTSIRMTLFFALATGTVITLFSEWFAISLFNGDDYQYVIQLFGLTIVLFGLNTFLISILNGTGEIKKLVAVNILTNLFSLFVSSLSAYFYGLGGALVAIAMSQSVVFFISMFFVRSSIWFQTKLFNYKFDKKYCLKLLEYTLMTVFGAVLIPLVNIGIRNHIIKELSLEQAGYWDSILKISTAYLGLITTSLSIYYLPKLSNLSDRLLIRREIINGYKVITPVLIVMITTIYFLREHIILLLYSSKFLEMKSLFFPQLLGDFFKIMSWLLSFLMLAKAMTKLFLTTQVVFLSLNFILAMFFISYMGLPGVVWSYVLTNFIYLIVIFFLFKSYLYK